MAALGIVGSLGFFVSISALLLGWPRSRQRRKDPHETDGSESLRLLGILSLGAILLGTVSGFGAVFAAAISSQIRAYDRISVFIALFALAALGVLADRFIRLRQGAAWRVTGPLVVALVMLLGVLDQTPASLDDGFRYDTGVGYMDATYAADATFGGRVQAELPLGASVYQLPYMAYPESAPLFKMTDYDPFRGYVHTTGLRWSYGAIKGRPDAAWQQSTAALPALAMIQQLRLKGFAAVWVQLNGYEDGGTAILLELSGLLGPPALVNADGVVAVWRL
jgi:phosphoglycerol transferase